MTNKPLILVTNDDGIAAAGISILADALETIGEVVVCAPAQQQSAVSHKISLSKPLRVHKLAGNRYAVTGSPVDSVFLALCQLEPRVPAIIVSGINHGVNIGADIYYSGTLAGAVEGAIRGLPAIAVSQQLPRTDVQEKAAEHTHGSQISPELKASLQHTAAFAARVAGQVLKNPLARGTVLNINAPRKPSQRFCWTRMGEKRYRTQTEKRLDPRGVPYYWVGSPEIIVPDEGVEADYGAVAQGFISVTPLRLDRTADLAEPDWRLDGFSRR